MLPRLNLRPLRAHQPGNRLERGAFARAVGPEQGDDAALGHGQRHPGHGQDSAVVDHFDVVDPQQVRGSDVAGGLVHGLFISGAGAWRQAFFLGERGGFFVDQRPQQRAVGGDPVADQRPVGAVPLLDPRRTTALVILAGQLEVLHQAEVAHVLEPRIVDVQVFQAPAPFFAVERALAEFGLGGANRFHRHRRVHQPGVVVDAAEILQVLEVALALVEDVLLETFMNLEIRAGRVWRQRQVPLGGSAGGQHVFAGTGPDVADDVVHREAETRGGLDRARASTPPRCAGTPSPG